MEYLLKVRSLCMQKAINFCKVYADISTFMADRIPKCTVEAHSITLFKILQVKCRIDLKTFDKKVLQQADTNCFVLKLIASAA
jgi:hypothetical protein